MQKPELKLKSTNILACTVLALSSIGFTGAAMASNEASSAAATQTAASTSEASERSGHKKMHRKGGAKRGHHHRHHRMGDAALLVPGYGPVPQDVVDSLSLNPQQVALLNDAKSFIKDHRQSQREQFKAKKQGGKRTLASPLDPHAALKRHDERVTAMQAVRAEGSQKWLAVWDSLDSDQQQTVSDYVVKRSEQRAKRAAEYREKREARQAQKS